MFFAAIISVIMIYLPSNSGRTISGIRVPTRSEGQLGQIDVDVFVNLLVLFAILSVSAIVYSVSIRSAIQTCIELVHYRDKQEDNDSA